MAERFIQVLYTGQLKDGSALLEADPTNLVANTGEVGYGEYSRIHDGIPPLQWGED